MERSATPPLAPGFEQGGRYYSMGVTSFDYDRDGDVDVYVANDSTPNSLYRNRGDGTFEEVGVETGAAFNADGKSQGGMGVGAGDVDGDGYLDLVVTNFAHDYYTLYRNLEGCDLPGRFYRRCRRAAELCTSRLGCFVS